jgi:hypothetical protein
MDLHSNSIDKLEQLQSWEMSCHIMTLKKIDYMLWGDFPSLYFRFYKVIMHGSANATNEGKNTNVILEIRLRL